MDGDSFIGLTKGEDVSWRDYFLYVYYWERAFPQSPTVFSLRSDKYKINTYYGVWDTDEFFDIQADPMEQNNLISSPDHKSEVKAMRTRLNKMMDELGGMNIPLNPNRGRSQNKRLRERKGDKAADFPSNLLLDKPENKDAN